MNCTLPMKRIGMFLTSFKTLLQAVPVRKQLPIMKQIIKLMGVPAEKMGALHEVFKYPMFKVHSPACGGGISLGTIVSAVSKDGETYTVQILLKTTYSTLNEGGLRGQAYPSINLLRAIYDALEIYPDEETFIPEL